MPKNNQAENQVKNPFLDNSTTGTFDIPSEPSATTLNNSLPLLTSTSNSTSKSNSKKKKLVIAILTIMLLLGGVFVGVYLNQQRQILEQKAAPTCSGCGVAPSPIPSYFKPPSAIGPFDSVGKLLIYYIPLNSSAKKIVLEVDNETKEIDISSFTSRQRINTGIDINQSSKLSIKYIEKAPQTSSCAPVQGPPYHSIGWVNINSDKTCGTALLGPPTGGVCTPMKKIDVSSHLSWIQSFGDKIVSSQCWADWMEWPGDYDFNDFLLVFAISPSPTSTPTPTIAPTITPTPTSTATPTQTPVTTPNSCGGTCSSNNDCQSGLYCYQGRCRNPKCPSETDCICSLATTTPTKTPTPTLITLATTTPTKTPTPTLITLATKIPTAKPEESLPNAGSSTPTVLGIGIGTILLIISLALAI